MRYLIGNDMLAKWRMFMSRADSDALGYISVVELDVRNYIAVLKTFGWTPTAILFQYILEVSRKT